MIYKKNIALNVCDNESKVTRVETSTYVRCLFDKLDYNCHQETRETRKSFRLCAIQFINDANVEQYTNTYNWTESKHYPRILEHDSDEQHLAFFQVGILRLPLKLNHSQHSSCLYTGCTVQCMFTASIKCQAHFLYEKLDSSEHMKATHKRENNADTELERIIFSEQNVHIYIFNCVRFIS